jgi:hypothetical protein
MEYERIRFFFLFEKNKQKEIHSIMKVREVSQFGECTVLHLHRDAMESG